MPERPTPEDRIVRALSAMPYLPLAHPYHISAHPEKLAETLENFAEVLKYHGERQQETEQKLRTLEIDLAGFRRIIGTS